MVRRNGIRRISIFALITATLSAQTPVPGAGTDFSRSAGTWPSFRIYQPREIPEADQADSPRLERLLRDGTVYLSLSDALALAIENNLDIAVARYMPLEADTDILRARAGQNLSGVQTQISTLSTGQSVASAGGGQGGTGALGQATGITLSASETASGSAGTGEASSFFGTQVINLDPTISTTMNWSHNTNPQVADFVLGTNVLTQDVNFYSVNYSQGFLTGTTLSLRSTMVDSTTNNLRANFNPTLTGDMTVSLRQRLTQGFGRAVNARNIRVAKNNREISDLAFKQQVITTVSRMQDLYWDLVGLIETAKAARADLKLAEDLLRDNERQVELGLLANVEVVRARAEAVSRRNTLLRAEANVRRQEIVVKNAITKHGPTSLKLAEVRIVPTDHIVIPETEPVEPLQDLVGRALQSRPAMAQARIRLSNSDINLKGIRNALLPSVDLTAFATNNALAGTATDQTGAGAAAPFFTGGLGNVMGQLFRRNFPDYGLRLEVSVPLKNRQAQADMTRELLRRRKQDLEMLQQENQIRSDVANALIALQQARDSYEVAREGRHVQEEMLEAERKRFPLGKSTIFQIVQAQRDLATARSSEIAAMTDYVKARAQLDEVTGDTLGKNNISLDEAYVGQVSKAPDPLPPAL